ncbi:ornithine carbamoyltransferase [Bacillus sp. HMF5848]|nr:ornithine carbamoyltransferase [Bacillus sp. HMF5848]RSK26454.1 ornithine carbamoyltransferase [Bacillus sp. HMF5848]
MSTLSKSLKGLDVLTLKEFTEEDILFLIQQALTLKAKHEQGEIITTLRGKTLALIFDKPSTRTRVSFEAGMMQLGGNAMYLSGRDLQLGRGEPISDTAKVLSQYVDAIMIRTFEHSKLEQLAEHASIPVINGLTDDHHPCQVLADLMTVMECKGDLKGNKMVYIGDGNNMAHSLLIGSAIVGMDCTVICPKGYEPKKEIILEAETLAHVSGANLKVSHDLTDVSGADIIYTDVWASMGQEEEATLRLQAFKHYQVNDEIVGMAKPDYIFMHCLPAHREEEVTATVIDGPNSVVFQQAGNRLHAQKALLQALLA